MHFFLPNIDYLIFLLKELCSSKICAPPPSTSFSLMFVGSVLKVTPFSLDDFSNITILTSVSLVMMKINVCALRYRLFPMSV